MTSLLFAIGTLTGLCSVMALYAWLFEATPIWPDDECELDYPQPPSGQPQWRDE